MATSTPSARTKKPTLVPLPQPLMAYLHLLGLRPRLRRLCQISTIIIMLHLHRPHHHSEVYLEGVEQEEIWEGYLRN